MFQAVKLASVGYFGGDPKRILNADVNVVLSILEYEKFTIDYQQAYQNINRVEK